MKSIKCKINYDIKYIIILITIFFSIQLIQNIDFKVPKLFEIIYLFFATIIYRINDFLSYSLIFLYLLYKFKETNI